ncbi:androgen-dependent TFPI-regulating protein-like isoform X2 [Rhodnius prolixus]|uniref:androgen-dependent TFPI-regulating protein-like isoform X2 n=1 Tax=Rhodnius prolixus TaxID=13249 RepID=UPI003D188803
MESLERKNRKIFKILSVSVHAVGAVHFIFGCYYDWVHVNIPPEVSPIFEAFGYKLKFLTYWNGLLQALYYSVCLINDILGPKDAETGNTTTLNRVKDFMEASIAFPIAMFVGSTFWGLMAIDRELVLPKALDPYFPVWLNHVMHTNIVVFQILETLTSSREYPQRKYSISALFLFQTCYLSWMHVVYMKSGLWVYPIFNVLNIPQRIVFFACSYATGFLFYFLGERINYYLWGMASKSKKKEG